MRHKNLVSQCELDRLSHGVKIVCLVCCRCHTPKLVEENQENVCDFKCARRVWNPGHVLVRLVVLTGVVR